MTHLLSHKNNLGEKNRLRELDSSPQFDQTMNSKHLRVGVIREEFVDLTGDHFSAVVLNQLLYWTQRVKDFDLLLEEERKYQPECNVSPRHGWIYKTADELNEETMLRTTRPTMRKYLKLLVDKGWLDERPNPHDHWNKTTQYRVNLRKLQEDLGVLGYSLPGAFPPREEMTLSSEVEEPSNHRNYHVNANDEHSKERNFPSKERNLTSMLKNFPSKEKNLTSYTYTETPSETTNREHTGKTRAREEFSIAEDMIALWEQHLGKKVIQLTEERKNQLECLFAFHFQNDIRLWEQFCLRVKASPFLRGEGARRWRVTLDWILVEGNLLKILEGNFDDPDSLESCQEEQVNPARDQEKEAILASIKDLVWKKWCRQLAIGVRLNESQMLHPPLSLVELKQIGNARFIECEDERLLWVGSQDSNVLRKIDDLRLKINWVFAKEYPKARTVRTRLEPSCAPILSPDRARSTLLGDRSEDLLKGDTHAQ